MSTRNVVDSLGWLEYLGDTGRAADFAAALEAPANLIVPIVLDGHKIDYHVVRSRAARKLRVRVGPSGIEVVQPAKRANGEVDTLLHGNADWIIGQMDRIERLQAIRIR